MELGDPPASPAGTPAGAPSLAVDTSVTSLPGSTGTGSPGKGPGDAEDEKAPTLSREQRSQSTRIATTRQGPPARSPTTRDLHIGAGPGAPTRDLAAEQRVRAERETASAPPVVPLTIAQRIEAGEQIPQWELIKFKTQKFMLGVPFTIFMLALTLWALFGTDIQAMSAPKSADGTYEVIAIVLFVIFMGELIANSLTMDGYFGSFFFFLDLVAAVSMLLDVQSIKDFIFGTGEQDLSVARAGRAARAGTRAGRLLKMTRLLRVIKLFRTVKKDRSGQEEVVERADALGTRVAELTTNKVVCGVLIMLVTFPALSVVTADTGPSYALQGLSKTFDPAQCTAQQCTQLQLDAQGVTWKRAWAKYNSLYGDRLLHLQLQGKDVFGTANSPEIGLLREQTEVQKESTYGAEDSGQDGNENFAWISKKDTAEDQAVLSLLTTLLVVLVLGAGSFTFGRDANKFSDQIAAPMKVLCEDMRAVAKLEYKPIRHEICGIQEVRDIQYSFMKMKGGLETFAKYVPRPVVRQITSGGREAVLGIEDKQMSFFFCDIQGFTTVCEAMNSQPHELLAFLGDFFKEMAAIVEDTGGTLIEYIGDAILATWNDRPEAPVEDHAFAAASASFRMRCRLEELHPIWQKRFHAVAAHGKGAPPIYLRTGVHTGHSWVGYIGSLSRMKYGLLGDHVEVAMTLEEINKQYGTFTLISEENYAASKRIQDTFVVRPVDVIELAGVSPASKLYEVIGVKPGLAPDAIYAVPPAEECKLTNLMVASPQLVKYFESHTEAMEKFIQQDFDGCLAILEQQKVTNGEPADVANTRKKQRHQGTMDPATGEFSSDPMYLADDLNVYVPSGAHPVPPGTWPGPEGDEAAAFLRAKVRYCKENPIEADKWAAAPGVTPDFGH